MRYTAAAAIARDAIDTSSVIRGTLHEGSNEDKPKTAPLSNLHVKQFYTKVRKHTQYLRSISSMWGHTVAFPSDEILPERIIEE